MGHTNAKYYCLEHPERSTKDYCDMCKSSMCNFCVEKYEDICPACRREYNIESENSFGKSSFFFVFLVGIIGLVITYCFLYHKYDNNAIDHLFPQGYLYFFLGISAAYTPFLFRKGDTLKILREVPFFGFKLMLITILLTIISFVPAVVFVYKVLTYFLIPKKLK
jgi:hypothetical protein